MALASRPNFNFWDWCIQTEIVLTKDRLTHDLPYPMYICSPSAVIALAVFSPSFSNTSMTFAFSGVLFSVSYIGSSSQNAVSSTTLEGDWPLFKTIVRGIKVFASQLWSAVMVCLPPWSSSLVIRDIDAHNLEPVVENRSRPRRLIDSSRSDFHAAMYKLSCISGDDTLRVVSILRLYALAPGDHSFTLWNFAWLWCNSSKQGIPQ